MMTPVSSTSDPAAAAATNATGAQEAPPHDLFAALLALLGALPLPQGERPLPERAALPEEPAAELEAEAGDDRAAAEQEAALATAPPPLLAALVLSAAPLATAEIAPEAAPATRRADDSAPSFVPAPPALAAAPPALAASPPAPIHVAAAPAPADVQQIGRAHV